jgi:hypothetical protein
VADRVGNYFRTANGRVELQHVKMILIYIYSTQGIDSLHELPLDVYPISAHDCSAGTWRVRRLHHSGAQYQIIPNAPNLDFKIFTANLEPWEEELLHFIQISTDVCTLCGKLNNGFSATSDGSVRYKTNGSFGWIISTEDGERLAQAYGPVRGY